MSAYEGEEKRKRREAYLTRVALPSALSSKSEESVLTPSTEDTTAQIEAEESPDLIIEVVPKRRNDDESAEFLDKFTKNAKGFYKKYILKEEIDDDESDDSLMMLSKRWHDMNEENLSFDDLLSVSSNNQQLKCHYDSFSEASNSGTTSKCDIIDSDATLILENLQHSKSYEEDIQHNNKEGIEAEIHKSHEDTNDFEEHDINRNEYRVHFYPENEVMRKVTSSQRVSIGRYTHSFSSNTNSPVANLNTAMRLSLESTKNSNETSIIYDSFPRVSDMERVSINNNVKSRAGLKKALSLPEYSTKRFKSDNLHTNEVANQYKSAFVQTDDDDHISSLVNVGTQTEELPNTYIDTHIQTEEMITNSVEVQTDTRLAGMIDGETQTNEIFEERWRSHGKYYNFEFNFF